MGVIRDLEREHSEVAVTPTRRRALGMGTERDEAED